MDKRGMAEKVPGGGHHPSEWLRNSLQPRTDSEGSGFVGTPGLCSFAPACSAVGVFAHFPSFEPLPMCRPSGCKLKWVWGPA